METQLKNLSLKFTDDVSNNNIKGIKSLVNFVSENSLNFSYDDFFLLWKYFFYAVWISDKVPFQRKLCVDLSQLIHSIAYEKIEFWFDSFWFIMDSEWSKLDCHRTDKFTLLIKIYLAESLRWLKLMKWENEAVSKLVSSWNYVLLNDSKKHGVSPSGVTILLIENILEELYEQIQNDENYNCHVFINLIDPFIQAYYVTCNQGLSRRIEEKIIKNISPQYKGDMEKIAEKLFEVAATNKSKRNLNSVFKAIKFLDTELSKLGRCADYQSILNTLR